MPGIRNLISSRIDLTRSLALAAFAVALIGTGTAQAADTDSIANTSNVPVQGHFFACSQVPAAPGAAWTPSSFSFDISWVDPRLRAYFLADRSHNGVTAMSGGSLSAPCSSLRCEAIRKDSGSRRGEVAPQ